MAVTATRETTITFSGDVSATQQFVATSNANSPGQEDIITLASGANTVSVPGGGSVPTALTVKPPAGNTTAITLKGVTGDTGVALHKTDPTTIALDPSVATLVLTAASQIVGVRLVWS